MISEILPTVRSGVPGRGCSDERVEDVRPNPGGPKVKSHRSEVPTEASRRAGRSSAGMVEEVGDRRCRRLSRKNTWLGRSALSRKNTWLGGADVVSRRWKMFDRPRGTKMLSRGRQSRKMEEDVGVRMEDVEFGVFVVKSQKSMVRRVRR